MKKKSSTNLSGPVSSSARSIHNTSLTLDEIQKKLASSAALNGGFDTLLFKIDKIEQSQGQLVNKVDKIHDAIYDPNEGIFARLSNYKLDSLNQLNEVIQNLSEIQIWKKTKDKEEVKEDQKNSKSVMKLEHLEKSVDNLVKNKDNTWSVVKWFLVAIGGGIFTIAIKWIQSKI